MNSNTFVDIKDWKGLYQINELGIIKRYYKNGNIKFLKPSIRNGYYFIGLCRKSINTKYYLHILLAQHFIPNPENKPEVNHKDRNRLNISLNNLE